MGFQAYFFRSLTLAEGDALRKHPVSVMRQSPFEIHSSFENDCHIRTIFLVVNRL